MAEETQAPVNESTQPEETATPPVGQNEAGQQTESTSLDWRSYIPEDMKSAPTWGKFKDGEDGLRSVLQSYRNLEQQAGSKYSVPEQGDHEGWQKLYNTLGRPESSEGYEVQFHDLDGKITWNEAYTEGLPKMAHALGFNNRQLQGLIDWYSDTTMQAQAELRKLNEDGLKELRETYGAAADRKFAQANALLEKLGGEDLMTLIGQSPLAYDPTFVKAMVRVAERFNEDELVITEASGITGKQEAIDKIKAIRNDPEHPYNKGDKDALNEMTRLYEMAYN